MSDDNKETKTVEQLQAELDQLKTENEKLHGIKSEAFKERDATKQKLKEIEEKKLAEANEFKTLYEKEKSLAEQLKAEADGLIQYKEKYQAVETERKAELLSRIEEEDLRKEYENSPFEEVKKAVRLYEIAKPKKVGFDGGRSGKTKELDFDPNKVKFNQLSMEQKRQLKETNPKTYDLIKERG